MIGGAFSEEGKKRCKGPTREGYGSVRYSKEYPTPWGACSVCKGLEGERFWLLNVEADGTQEGQSRVKVR